MQHPLISSGTPNRGAGISRYDGLRRRIHRSRFPIRVQLMQTKQRKTTLIKPSLHPSFRSIELFRRHVYRFLKVTSRCSIVTLPNDTAVGSNSETVGPRDRGSQEMDDELYRAMDYHLKINIIERACDRQDNGLARDETEPVTVRIRTRVEPPLCSSPLGWATTTETVSSCGIVSSRRDSVNSGLFSRVSTATGTVCEVRITSRPAD